MAYLWHVGSLMHAPAGTAPRSMQCTQYLPIPLLEYGYYAAAICLHDHARWWGKLLYRKFISFILCIEPPVGAYAYRATTPLIIFSFSPGNLLLSPATNSLTFPSAKVAILHRHLIMTSSSVQNSIYVCRGVSSSPLREETAQKRTAPSAVPPT